MVTCFLFLFVTALCKRNPVNDETFLLGDINELVFTKGSYTTSRRVDPILQLNCVSGCNLYDVDLVVCDYVGNEMWECRSNFPEHIDWDGFYVECEGYEDSTDPRKLIGSCGLFYSLIETMKTPTEKSCNKVYKDSLSILKRQIKKLNTENQEIVREIKSRNERLKNLERNINEIEYLERTYFSLKNDVERLRNERSSLNNKISQLNQEYNSIERKLLKDSIKNLERTIETKQKEINDIEEQLERTMEKKQKEINDIEQKRLLNTKTLENVLNEMFSRTEELAGIHQQINMYEEKRNTMPLYQLDQLGSVLDQKKEELMDLTQNINNKESDLSIIKEEYDFYVKYVNELKAKKKKFEHQLNEESRRTQDLRDEFSDLTRRLSETVSKKKETEEILKEISKERRSMEDEMKRIKASYGVHLDIKKTYWSGAQMMFFSCMIACVTIWLWRYLRKKIKKD